MVTCHLWTTTFAIDIYGRLAIVRTSVTALQRIVGTCPHNSFCYNKRVWKLVASFALPSISFLFSPCHSSLSFHPFHYCYPSLCPFLFLPRNSWRSAYPTFKPDLTGSRTPCHFSLSLSVRAQPIPMENIAMCLVDGRPNLFDMSPSKWIPWTEVCRGLLWLKKITG